MAQRGLSALPCHQGLQRLCPAQNQHPARRRLAAAPAHKASRAAVASAANGGRVGAPQAAEGTAAIRKLSGVEQATMSITWTDSTTFSVSIGLDADNHHYKVAITATSTGVRGTGGGGQELPRADGATPSSGKPPHQPEVVWSLSCTMQSVSWAMQWQPAQDNKQKQERQAAVAQQQAREQAAFAQQQAREQAAMARQKAEEQRAAMFMELCMMNLQPLQQMIDQMIADDARKQAAPHLPATKSAPLAPAPSGPWPPAPPSPTPGPAGARAAAAEAAAAAATAWASAAVGHEAAAEEAARRADTQPAVQQAPAAAHWAQAAAAWRAAHDALEAAMQADPESEVVRQAKAAVEEFSSFKRQRRGLQG